MKMKLVYPRWAKLERQTEFHLPPHGPVVFAATVPDDVELSFTDENVQTLDLDGPRAEHLAAEIAGATGETFKLAAA